MMGSVKEWRFRMRTREDYRAGFFTGGAMMGLMWALVFLAFVLWGGA